MTNTENRDTHPKRKPRRITIRLTRNLVLYYRKAGSGAHKGEHRRDSYTEKIYQRIKDESWRKPIEALGLVILFGYTSFAGYQSCQMKRATNAAVAQMQVAIEAERPWVAIGDVSVIHPIAHGRQMFVSAPTINAGKSAAIYAESWVNLRPFFALAKSEKGDTLFEIIPGLECTRPKRKWSNKLTGSVILPGDPIQNVLIAQRSDPMPDWMVDAVTTTNRGPIPTPVPTPYPQWFSIPNNADLSTLALFLVGCTEYFDESHNAHRTTFCKVWMPSLGKFAVCSQGNYAD